MDGSTAVWPQIHDKQDPFQQHQQQTHYNENLYNFYNNPRQHGYQNYLIQSHGLRALRHVSFYSPTTCLCSSSSFNLIGKTNTYNSSNCNGKSTKITTQSLENRLKCKCMYYCKTNNSYDRPKCLSFATEWLV